MTSGRRASAKTDVERSWFENRNGVYYITEVELWRSVGNPKIGTPNMVYLDATGKRNNVLRGGLCITEAAMDELCAKWLGIPFSMSDLIYLLEIARLGIAMNQYEIAEEMDISDDEMCRLRDMLQAYLDQGGEDENRAGDPPGDRATESAG